MHIMNQSSYKLNNSIRRDVTNVRDYSVDLHIKANLTDCHIVDSTRKSL